MNTRLIYTLSALLMLLSSAALMAQSSGRPSANTSTSSFNTTTSTTATPTELLQQVSVVIEDIVDPYGINVYPNPADNILYVEVNIPAHVHLTTATGEVVLQTSGSGRLSLDTTNQPNGMYFVVVSNGIAAPMSRRAYIIHR